MTDEILANQEGSYISLDKENVPYVVKRWYQGRECDTRSESDIYAGISAMAALHKVMQMPVQAHYVKEPLSQNFSALHQRASKIRKFVSVKWKKNDFELQFLDSIRSYLKHGRSFKKAGKF